MFSREEDDINFMREALSLAREAGAEGEIPVGAVVVKDGSIVGRGANTRERDRNAVAHAEINAIEDACRSLGTRRLAGCCIYVTLEPCPMCAGAVMNAGIDRIVFGAFDERAGAVRSVLEMYELPLGYRPQIKTGVLQEECAGLLALFFRQRRKNQ